MDTPSSADVDRPGSRPGPGSGFPPQHRRLRVSPRLVRGAVAAGAVGALTLVDPTRLGPWRRAAYRLSTATAAGVVTADAERGDEPLLSPARDGALTGALALGLADLGEHLDRRVVDLLGGWGVRRPRLLLAGLGVAGIASLYLLPRAEQVGIRQGSIGEAFDEPEPVDLPSDARALVELLLAAPPTGGGIHGAPALREQLEAARSLDLGYTASDVPVTVDEPARLAVPHHQTWPQTGEFTRGGIRYELQLLIADGRLAMLSVDVAEDEARIDEAVERLSSPSFVLPEPGHVTVRVQSEDIG